MNARPGMHAATRHAQRGVVLYISMLLLLVLTLIGLAVTRHTTLDGRLAASQRDHDLAFQAAEAALRNGEGLLQSNPGSDPAGNGYYDSTSTITWETADWAGTGDDDALRTLPYEGSFDPMPAHMPRFYLVRISGQTASTEDATDVEASSVTIYKVIAKGWGIDANDAVVLESTFEVSAPGTGKRLSWRQLQ